MRGRGRGEKAVDFHLTLKKGTSRHRGAEILLPKVAGKGIGREGLGKRTKRPETATARQ